MTKKEIVRTISEEMNVTQGVAKEVVQRTFDAIIDTLVSEGRIELRNFGVFEVKARAERQARNPQTGDKVIVPERNVVVFKPGKEMDTRVNQSETEQRFGESGFMPDAKAKLDSGIPVQSETKSMPPKENPGPTSGS